MASRTARAGRSGERRPVPWAGPVGRGEGVAGEPLGAPPVERRGPGGRWWHAAGRLLALLGCVGVLLVVAGYEFVNPVPAQIGSPPGFAPRGTRSLHALRRAHTLALSPQAARRLLGIPATATGAGTTLALIEQEVGFAPGALEAFDRRFGLPPARLRLVNATGAPVPRATTADLETMLDVQWAHVIAPFARIAVVFWRLSPGCAARLRAALAAVHPDAVAVTFAVPPPLALGMARDGGAFCYTPLQATTAFSSAGDGGAGLALPAMLPFVTAVGGAAWGGRGWVSWAAAGSGVADLAYPRPHWQTGWTTSVWRAIPDVAWLAGYPGVPVYTRGWVVATGTSVATPLWAALWADADQLRRLAGKPPLRGPAAPVLYELARRDPGVFCRPAPARPGGCLPGAGWEAHVGLGLPRPARLLAALVALPPGCCREALPPFSRGRAHRWAAIGLLLVSAALGVAAGWRRGPWWARLLAAGRLWAGAALCAGSAVLAQWAVLGRASLWLLALVSGVGTAVVAVAEAWRQP